MIPKSLISFFHNEKKIIISTILKLDREDLEKEYLKVTDKLNSLSFLILNNTTFEKEDIFEYENGTDFKPNIDIASNAPLLPADTIAPASRLVTAAIACPILVVFALLRALEAFSHFNPVGKPPPPLPRRPDFFISSITTS